MSFDSIMFLLFMFLVIGVTVFKLRSEKSERGSGSLDIGADFSLSGDSSGPSLYHDSSHHVGCDGGTAHDGGFGDCGHGGFDWGGGRPLGTLVRARGTGGTDSASPRSVFSARRSG